MPQRGQYKVSHCIFLLLSKPKIKDKFKDVNVRKLIALNCTVNALLEGKFVVKTVYVSAAEINLKMRVRYFRPKELQIIGILDFSRTFPLSFL